MRHKRARVWYIIILRQELNGTNDSYLKRLFVAVLCGVSFIRESALSKRSIFGYEKINVQKVEEEEEELQIHVPSLLSKPLRNMRQDCQNMPGNNGYCPSRLYKDACSCSGVQKAMGGWGRMVDQLKDYCGIGDYCVSGSGVCFCVFTTCKL